VRESTKININKKYIYSSEKVYITMIMRYNLHFYICMIYNTEFLLNIIKYDNHNYLVIQMQ